MRLKSNLKYNQTTNPKLVLDKSSIIKPNNGVIGKYSNKCMLISLIHGVKTIKNAESSVDVMVGRLRMGVNEQFDTQRHSKEFNEICNELAVCVYIHYYANDVLYTHTQAYVFGRNNNFTNIVHIAYCGMHFEYINWNVINTLPDYNKFVYAKSIERVNKEKRSKRNISIDTVYQLLLSGIEDF